jgi:2',3'-cyclic-nucleotide 2'-phosphodiesterase (5'-nucleotidase family)
LATLGISHATTVSVKSPLDGNGSGKAETTLGDLVADAVRSNGGADIAFVPSSELRPTVVPAGDIDSGQIVAALRAPSDDSDTVVVLRLTGAQIRKALDRSVSRTPSPYEGFLQVSGLTFNITQTDGVNKVGDISVGGNAIGPIRVYTVAMPHMLSDGALGYFEVWGKGDVSTSTNTPISRAVGDFSISRQPLDYHLEGRISTP